MPKKVKLKWFKKGYKVDFCKWKGYYAETFPPVLIHDMFEHRPQDEGTNRDEVRAIGAKLRFDGVYTYFDKADGRHYFENRFRYNRRSSFENIRYHRKGKRGLEKLAKTYSGFGTHKEVLALVTEGFNHAKQYTPEAYFRAFKTNFKRYHNLELDLEISLVTGKVLKKTPRTRRKI